MRKNVKEVVELAEDQQAIREKLPELGLAAFVADDSVLPRESGISSKPMKQSVKFVSPETMRVTLELPHRGKITGMGVPKGNHPDRRRRLSWKIYAFKCVGIRRIQSYCRRWQGICDRR